MNTIGTLTEVHELLVKGEVSSFELTRSILDRIEALEPSVKAYVTVSPDLALEQAKAADKRLSTGGDVTTVTGIPMALKDCLCTKGIRTTCSSRILQDYVPPYDATVVTRLFAAGAVLVGKTNMDEFGMGSSTENSAFFPTRNPWDLTRVPGGSSGGSAAAVAAREAVFSIGEDTGGSIRVPASFSGVVGLKPTYGRVSRYGLVALGSSFDSIGPMTQRVADCALVLGIIAGRDPKDATSASVPVPDYAGLLDGNIKGMRIGVPSEYFVEGTNPGVQAAVQEAIRKLSELGAEVGEVSLPHTKYGVPTYYLIVFGEISANLARYDGIKYGFSSPQAENLLETYLRTREEGLGHEVKRRIMLGTYELSAGYYDAYYLRAQKVRTLIKKDFDAAFERYDALVAPTCPTVAFPFGERVDNPLSMYLSDVFAAPINVAGLPALVLPCGFADGMPVGLQLIGRPFGEDNILRIGFAYEQATEWHKMAPKVDVAP